MKTGPMSERIAFLIMAHQEPALLRRLVVSLTAPWARFFIHIDKKVGIAPFQNALAGISEVTLIHDRVDVYWGGWSQVQATLNLLKASVGADACLLRFALLSGACYPVASTAALHNFLFADNSEYISAIHMPKANLHKPLSRLTKWHFQGGDHVAGLAARAIRLVNKVALGGPSRSLKTGLRDYVPYTGSQWWVLTREAVETVLRVASNRPEMIDLFKYSNCPDEAFFQTILTNSTLASRIRPSLTFVDWSRPLERPSLIDQGHISHFLIRSSLVPTLTVQVLFSLRGNSLPKMLIFSTRSTR